MATRGTPLHVYDGDIIQLYCPLESGYVYSELNSTSDLELDIVSKEKIKVADFATFSIILKKESTNEGNEEKKSTIAVTEKIVYGSIVYLKHQASDKFVIANNKNEVKLSADAKSLFKVDSPNHELAWGEELKDNDLIKLELFSGNDSLIDFHCNDQRKYYKLTLKTVFNVQIYCQKQDIKSIKGGSIVFLATLPKIELYGYIRAKGSFIGSEIESVHEQPSASYGRSIEEPVGAEQLTEEEQSEYLLTKKYRDLQKHHKIKIRNFTVYLIKFMEKKLPEYGDTLFQLERVSGPPGSPFQFGEECRIKHLFTLKYIFITPEEKVSLCDFNEEKSKFKIQQVSGSRDQEEVCNFDEITFQHVESSLYLSVNLKLCQQEDGLTVSEDSSVLQSQFKLLQVEKSLLMDSYYAIGFSSFLCDSFKMLHNGDIDKTIHKQIENKVAQIEGFYKAQRETTKYRFIYMLWNLDVVIEGLSKRSPQENGGCKLCVIKKGDQEEVDGGKSTLPIDLHIEKLLYEKSLEQPDVEEWTPLVTLVELLKKMGDSEELLKKYGILKDNIENCLESYVKIFLPLSVKRTPDGQEVAIEMNSCGSTAPSPMQNVPVRPIEDDDNANVSQLLLMLHLLFTKYIFIPVRNQSSADESIQRKNFRIFFENNCHNWCKILSQLIANEDYNISYMSVSLLFDIYMKEKIIDKKKSIPASSKLSVVTVKNEELQMIKKVVQMQYYYKNRNYLIKFLTRFYSQDKSIPNVAAHNLEFVYNSGLFHIILEHTLNHNAYPIFYEEEVICCCFKLLQGLAASNKEVRNEIFLYFFHFLQFKQVTNVMICLLNEIFYCNSDLCNNLTKSDLDKIFYTAVLSGTSEHYQWTIVLQTIIEYSNQKAQKYVAQLILKNCNDYLGHVLNSREQHSHFLDILYLNEEQAHRNECHLLLNITDLLASCASGECQSARLVAMNFFTFDDLINILMSKDVIMYIKLPFIRILTVTYLIDGGHFTTNCSQYKNLWTHINETIERFTPKGGNITSKSHWVMYQEIVHGGKYKQPIEEQPVQDMMELLYIIDGVIPFLSQFCRQMSHHDQSSEVYIEAIINFLNSFTSQDNSEPNFALLTVAFLYNSGLFHIVLEYALKHNVNPSISEEAVHVLCCCFKLLQGIAASNREVRNEMFLYFFHFLQFKKVTNAMICLLNEIFYCNSDLCNNLTKSDLDKIFYTAVLSGTSEHYQWTIVLQTIIEYSNQKAQKYVAQLILKNCNDYLGHVLNSREQHSHFLDILYLNEEQAHRNECHLLLNITDLLASCASGECQSARSIAMKFFTFDDLINILMSKDVIMYIKLPFIRILTVTYLIDGGHFTTNCSQYKNLWTHINETIERFTPKGGNITSKSHWVMYQEIVHGGKYKQPIEEQPVQDMMELLYIIDGVIPFLSQFCRQMSHHDQSSEVYIEAIINFLNSFTSQDNSEPNVAPLTVVFLYNSGLFHIVLEYALKHNVNPSISEEAVHVLCCCFKLLQGIAASNREVRNEMFLYFFHFLQFKKVTNAMICLLNEIFYCNSDLCNNLTKSDLDKIFYTAVLSGTSEHYQWTIVLQTIIEYSNQKAQKYVAQLILKNCNDYLGHVLNSREQHSHFLDILYLNEEQAHRNECHLLLNITDLLASCASGECQSARLVAMNFFTFDDLINILMSKDVIMYIKLPFIRILTVTYLIDGGHFTTNCSQYKKLWTHINETIERFTPKSGNITSKSHWVIYQEIVHGGKYKQPVKDLLEQPNKDVMELLYIIDGVIPFLSQICQQMSHQSSEKYICTTEELQSVGKKLVQLEHCSEKLLSSKCLENINLLLKNKIEFPHSPPNNTSRRNTEVTLVRRCESIEPPSDCHEKIVELLKTNNDDIRAVLNKVILILKNLIILQKRALLSCFKRIDVEQTISRMLALLQTVIKEVIPPSEKSLDEKELKDLVKVVENILYLNDCSNKEHTIFHLLQSQNNEIIFQVVKVLKMQCFEKAAKEVQEMMISSCAAYDNIYIVQVYGLLREAHIKYNVSHSQHDSTASEKLNDTEKGITAALDVIILLCDRQQRNMQDAMRNSKVFICGSNVVSQVAVFLFHISKDLNKNNDINMAHTAVQALVKMCTGNYNNQHIAYKVQVVTSINHILGENVNNLMEFAELKSLCIKLLEVMLEEIDQNSSKLAIFIANHLKIDVLYKEMQNLWKRDTTTTLCRAYHILKRIADYKQMEIDELVEPFKKNDKVHEAMWNYCEHRSKSVEIVYKLSEEKETVTQVYFPYDPNLHIKSKNYIQSQIRRSTPQEKLLDLLEWTKAVEKTHKQKSNNIWSLIFFRLSKLLLIYLTILLNLIVLYTVSTPPNYNNNDGVCTANDETCSNSTSSSLIYFQPIWSPEIPLWSTVILTILGAIHAVLAVLMVIRYFYRNWRPLHFSHKKLLYRFLRMLLGKYITYQIYLHSSKLNLQKSLQSKERYEVSWISFQSIYRIFFMACSLVAWIPIPGLKYLYCLCMLYPFLQFDVMSYISRAITRSIKQLVSVLLLCFVFIYIYAVISFAFLNNYFSEERDQFCGSLWQCFFTVSRLGLLGTLGYQLEIRPSRDFSPTFTLYSLRTFYDLIFFIIVTTLGLNIIVAILVNRFSEMREKQDKVDKDNESRCFICSIPKSEFDKRNKDFKKHVKEEHSKWDYMSFIIHVKHLPENDHNALEKYVSDKIPDTDDQKSVDFFPIFRAKALPDYKHSERASEETLAQLVKKIEKMEESMKSKDIAHR